jgi:hypothetical protein
VWINPAALAVDKTIYFLYAAMYSDGSLSDDWGMSITGDGIGISYRALDDFSGGKYREYIFGAGSELWHGIYWGGSYRYIKGGPDFYNKRHFWNFGFYISQGRSFNVGAVFSNLNRGRVDGLRSLIEQIYSISYKTAENRFILSIEMSRTSKQSLSDADYYYGLDYFPSPKLSIYAGLDGERNYQIGFRIYFGKYFAGGQGYRNSNTNNFDAILYSGIKLPTGRSLR